MDWEKIDSQDTNVIMHVYRGEIQRINTWRMRMDRTTNWAVVLTVGVLTFSLSSAQVPQWTMFPGLILLYVLLFSEARRYRYYDAWRGRVRALEEIFLAKFFNPDLKINEKWQEVFSRDLREPEYKMTWQEAVKRRLKRIYLWIILIFLGSWIGKIYIHPELATSFSQFFQNVGGNLNVLGGAIMFFSVLAFVIGSILYFFISAPSREAKGRMREEESFDFDVDEYFEDEKCEE